MWRQAKTSYVRYSNEMAQILRQCLKDPHRAKVLEKNQIHLVEKKWANGAMSSKTSYSDFSAFNTGKGG